MKKTIALANGLAIIFLLANAARAEPPDGFAVSTFAKLPFLATDLEFAPDGRLFALDKKGAVWTLQNGQLAEAPILQLSVTDDRERGLLGIAFDPAFSDNGNFYLYYTAGPDSAGYAGSPKNRLSRFTLDADGHAHLESEKILLDNIASDAGVHNGGVVKVGPDGKLYVGVGDGGKRSQNAEDLSVLNGKVLRINLDGSVPPDNPFVGKRGARGEIWASGFRNPWRIAFDPFSGRLYAADVGGGKQEEIDVVERGKFYGWPKTEGNDPPGIAGVTYPIYAYTERSARGASITGGEVYAGTTFPSEYRGKYFFGDFVQNFLRTLTTDAEGSAGVETFDPSLGWMIDLAFGPDGALYASLGKSQTTGEILKVAYTGVTAPSVKAEFSAEPSWGELPLAVEFTAAKPPADAAWEYAWNFGDGQTSRGQVVRHRYTKPGKYAVLLEVTDRNGRSATETTVIHAGNRAPRVEITAPAEGIPYRAGNVIRYAGNATDPEDGELEAGQFRWEIISFHDEHRHPFLGPIVGEREGEFTVPTDGEADADVGFEIVLTVADHAGLTSEARRRVLPLVREVTLASVPAGLTLFLDGSPVTTPHTFRTVVGFPRTLEAPPTAAVASVTYRWRQWVSGGEREQAIAPGDARATYTAAYVRVGPPWRFRAAIGAGIVTFVGVITLTMLRQVRCKR